MTYRPDIDGLRAISVIAVILFHANLGLVTGGYVGVDIFFVISGYLITRLIYSEIQSGEFSFAGFYKRRIARLLPALIITLLLVFIFGLLFYDNKSFDNLGKEIFFSAIGAANILFGKGVNYFAQDAAVRPLIHLWSLGVEEQFYLVWPTMLILLAPLKNRGVLLVIAILFLVSFFLAVVAVESSPKTVYFYPQYRAFELLAGAFVAILMQGKWYGKIQLKWQQKEIIASISIALIILPMFLLDEESTFPGINTLYPCIGTALFIAFAFQSRLSKLLSVKPLVLIGLISYPLYLYHQPVISYLHFFDLAESSLFVLFIAVLISVPLAWLTYKYIEKPIRKRAHQKHKLAHGYVVPLVSCLAALGVSGLYVAKSEGMGGRFKLLNPFAYQVSMQSEPTFHSHYRAGIKLSKKDRGKTLFIGDSLLQQYVFPVSKALNLDKKDIDTVSRGGCVLLKGVEFRDKFADISCNDLREKLYKLDGYYDNVVISQNWDSYGSNILNITNRKQKLEKWTPFINSTIEHFKTRAGRVIIVGGHLKIDGISELKPTIFLSEVDYRKSLAKLNVLNKDELLKSYTFFNQWSDDALIIHPLDIWSENKDFKLHDGQWSFFSDLRHASSASTNYLAKRMRELLDSE